MAGLQQYNFFPTDLFYPRPQPQPSSTKPSLLPIQTSNPHAHAHAHAQDLHPQLPPTTTSLVFANNNHSLAPVHNNKPSNFSSHPLSSLLWNAQDEDDDQPSSIV
ncbi:uncharacterized protein LOC113863546 [Abrus precatorius]|uniref:Uncharacterized protein LOC113863546 n=1 Tax=Abrus precatorius TaxID=3816 RepID=A0A8B8L9S5_ABRPR|nr:uncharacterized protein LOC113863546 [Abrus precatorius]